MNPYMDPLGNRLTTCPVQMRWEFTIEQYNSWQFGFIHNPDHTFGNSSVWIWTRTWSDGPEPLPTLSINLETTSIMAKRPSTALWLYMMQHPKLLKLCWGSFQVYQKWFYPYCQLWSAILRSQLEGVANPPNYNRCNTKNHWRYVASLMMLCWCSAEALLTLCWHCWHSVDAGL